METIKFADPCNEMVIFRFDDCWEVIGPFRAKLANEAVSWCVRNKRPVFICLEEEFKKFGKPVEPGAKDYFQNPPEWWYPKNCEGIYPAEIQLSPDLV